MNNIILGLITKYKEAKWDRECNLTLDEVYKTIPDNRSFWECMYLYHNTFNKDNEGFDSDNLSYIYGYNPKELEKKETENKFNLFIQRKFKSDFLKYCGGSI